MMKYLYFIFLLTVSVIANPAMAEDVEPVHYAYANYLGSGLYRTTGQDASLISMPFSFDLKGNNKISYGLRLPISLGFFDFSFADLPNLDLPDEVGTITFTPGLEVNYQYNANWLFETYADLGYARNLTTGRGVTVHSAGISALYNFAINQYDLIWANRLYYANYDGNGYDAHDSYAAVQLGLDAGLPVQYTVWGYSFQPRVFTTAFWYFNEVNFFNREAQALGQEQSVTLTNSVELGFTLKFAKRIGYSWAGIDRLGLSYRYSKDISVVRLLFSFPI